MAYSFMLEAFIFVSGYVLCMQVTNKQYQYKSFVVKKARRLLIPSIIFSIIYFFCFYEYTGCLDFLFSVLNGCGHLWYLPMSFWCFVIGLLFYSLKISEMMKLFICGGLAMCSGVLTFLPFRIGNSCYYLFFFYLGMFMYMRKERIMAWMTARNVFLLWLLYLLSYISLSFCKEWLSGLFLTSFAMKLLREVGLKSCIIVYSCLGVISFYSVVNLFLKKRPDWKCPQWLFVVNALCFGVYVYQQFILKYLYYSTSLPSLTGTYLLPWVGCIVTVVLSTICAYLTVKTKVGKYLIG